MNNISGINNIQEILENLGYQLTPDKDGWRALPIYRDSNNNTALKIYPEGNFVDFAAGIKGNITDLVKLSMGLDSVEKAKEWLDNKNYNFIQKSAEIQEPLIKSIKTLDIGFLEKLVKNHFYWENRGIKREILEELGGGTYKNRYYFGIQNSKKELIGLTSRDITGKSEIRWRHRGERKNWVWAAQINSKDIINKKEVILVEGPGDLLSLLSCGIRNVLCLFGLEISFAICNYLLRIPDVKIILALNSDNPGLIAMEKGKKKLKKYFDSYKIETRVIPNHEGSKDFNDLLLTNSGKNSILKWYGR